MYIQIADNFRFYRDYLFFLKKRVSSLENLKMHNLSEKDKNLWLMASENTY